MKGFPSVSHLLGAWVNRNQTPKVTFCFKILKRSPKKKYQRPGVFMLKYVTFDSLGIKSCQPSFIASTRIITYNSASLIYKTLYEQYQENLMISSHRTSSYKISSCCFRSFGIFFLSVYSNFLFLRVSKKLYFLNDVFVREVALIKEFLTRGLCFWFLS